MYIIQFSDFHIKNDSNDFNAKSRILEKMLSKISELINNENEKILCIVNGDIIDHSEELTDAEVEEEFEKSSKLINRAKQHFSNKDFIMGICPGNHDIVNSKITEFNNVAKKYMPDDFIDYPYVLEIIEESTDFIFINTVYDGDYNRGHIDFDSLNDALNNSHGDHKHLVVHHTVLSMDDTDTSSIINAAKLINIIDSNHIEAVFHGHTHGIDGTMIGHNNCILLGVGAAFSNNNPDVNSQFNFYHYKRGQILSALNCRYNSDIENLSIPTFSEYNLLPLLKSQYNYFSDNTFSACYSKLLNKLSANGNILYNVTLDGLFDYQSFCADIHNNFYSKNELGYTYGELACKWENSICPDELYFNHGEFFTENGIHGIEYVIDQLKKKPTSSRAMLSTINSRDIIKNSDDEFLPSFTTIQFSFHKNDNTLFVSVNYRALEASRFLKINICEIFYLLQKISHTPLLNFEKIQLSIHAFRVQLIENFRCFLKSEIDTMQAAKIAYIVYNKDNEKLRNLLIDKRDCKETVVISTGMNNLYAAMETAVENGATYYRPILDNTKKVLDCYNELIEERKKSSINSENIRRIYDQLAIIFNDIMTYLDKEGEIINDNK